MTLLDVIELDNHFLVCPRLNFAEERTVLPAEQTFARSNAKDHVFGMKACYMRKEEESLNLLKVAMDNVLGADAASVAQSQRSQDVAPQFSRAVLQNTFGPYTCIDLGVSNSYDLDKLEYNIFDTLNILDQRRLRRNPRLRAVVPQKP